MLLSGYPPFHARSEEKTILLIENGRYNMRPERWERISPDAKNFVQRLLEMDEHTRMSAEEALKHPWILGRKEACQRLFSMEVIFFSRPSWCSFSPAYYMILCSVGYVSSWHDHVCSTGTFVNMCRLKKECCHLVVHNQNDRRGSCRH